MIELTCVDHYRFDSGEYRRLLERSRTTAFQQPEWLGAFYRHLADSSGTRGLIVLGRSTADGELRLLLPLVRTADSSRTTIGYAHADVTDYACPVVEGGLFAAPAQLAKIRARLLEVLRPFDRLRIQPVRDRDLELWRALVPIAETPLEFGSHEVTPDRPFHEWRNRSLGSARRSQLDRKMRRLSDLGPVDLETLSPANAEEAIVWAHDARRGRFTDDPIQRSDTLRFYRQVAREGADSGFARTMRLRCGDDIVGVCFGVTRSDRFCYLLLACDYPRYGRFSPGTMILDLAMSRWIAAGGSTFDFTIGDEPYKSSFRCTRHDLFRLDSPPTA